MLSKTEKEVLKIINDNANISGSALMSAEIISACASKKVKLNAEAVERTLKSLEVNGYVDVVNTYKKDIPYYCIVLSERGKNYLLVCKEDARVIKSKIFLAVLGAVISFLIGRILYTLFS